jgi:cytochrome c-type biogenesis protein
MGALLLAYLAGLVTLLNPCVLPVLPLVLGAALGQSRHGPVALAAGLVLSFAGFGLLITAFGFSLGIDDGALRMGAAVLLLIAGAVLLWPRAQAVFATAMGPVASGGQRLLGGVAGNGLGGQFAVGLLLGLVWAPCVGPTLGVAIAAASRGENLAGAFITFLVFGLGVATALLGFAALSRRAVGRARVQTLARHGKALFGALLIVVALLILSGLDKMLEAWVLDLLPAGLIAFTTRF